MVLPECQVYTIKMDTKLWWFGIHFNFAPVLKYYMVITVLSKISQTVTIAKCASTFNLETVKKTKKEKKGQKNQPQMSLILKIVVDCER